MTRTRLPGQLIRSGSIPPAALPSGVISSSVQLTTSLPVGTVSHSAQVVVGVANQTIAPTTVNATNILSGSVLQTDTNALIGGKLAVTGSTELTGAVTASILTPNQAIFTNASDGLVSNAITGTGNVVMSASPTLTGTLTATSISASANISASSGLFSGNVGIGTSFPSASLHVSGTMMIQGVIERANITGSAPPTTLNVDAISGSVFYLSGSSVNNWTVNFRGSAATSLNSIMFNGQSMTFAVLVNHGATGFTASAHQVDGVSVTPRWQGGTLPSGSGTSTDIYSYTLIKLASASYNIFASQTRFA